MRALAIAMMLLAGCGEDGKRGVDAATGTADTATTDAVTADAAVDAPTALNKVEPVDCATVTPVATVTTVESPTRGFSPNVVMINVNDVVKFTPAAIHNVVPDSTLPSDPGLRSGALGAVACLRFTATGVFNYQCQPHPGMKGRVTVQ